jgi:tripartite ATP-independent transporter DctM subunit
MSVGLLTSLLFGLMLALLALGLPIAFAMGGSALVLGLATMGPESLYLLVTGALGHIRTIVLVAAPLFIFMGNVLRVSGIADDLYSAAQKWIGGLRGGLAVGTIIICTIFAACTGVSGAATVTMGLVALPSMLRRGYDKRIAAGCVMSGGALGQLIPPSLLFILYGFMASESVGRLFAGGVLPGLVMAGLFIAYIVLRCALRHELGPEVPRDERASWPEKLASLRSLVLPFLLIGGVLGSIFSGFATPTEAAAIGAAGGLLVAAAYRRLTWVNLKDAFYQTLSLTAMLMWIVVGATAFTTVFTAAGGSELIRSTLVGLEVSPMVIIIGMQVTLFVLGMFMDPAGIILLTAPIYAPVVTALGFSTVWFGVLLVVNMEMAFLTPPYGINLFYIKGVAQRQLTMADIYRSAFPFVVVQAIGLILLLVWPQLALWLPNLMFGPEL